jgi:predicted dehydrogenase
MTIRVAAIEVSHWHALHDAAYLRHLIAMPNVELVAIQDSDVALVARRAAEVGSTPTFTDYRQMLATTRPDFETIMTTAKIARYAQKPGMATVPAAANSAAAAATTKKVALR